MRLTAMLTLAASRLIIVFLLTLSGCSMAAPDASREGLQKYKSEDPEQYVVDSKNYPTYRIESSIYRPPSGMVKGNVNYEPKEEIRTTDVWKVTHVYGSYYYIFSDEYQARQEQLIKKSYEWNVPKDYYIYHLTIDKTGKVIGGWVSFKNKKLVLLPSERRIVFDPSYWRNPEWDKQPKFKPIEK